MADRFTHLHLHSVYSLLDGAIRIKDLVQHIKQLGMESVAITDHGNMFGAIEFYEEAMKAGIKPILGCEFYVSPGSRFEKRAAEKVADGNAYHLILLAKNQVGYKNMIKMASRAYTEGFYRKPRIDYELLAEHTEGLVGMSACLAGEINQKIYREKQEEAYKLSGHLNELFGDGNFFLEIQKHGIPEQDIVAKGVVDIHRKTGIPMVLTNDSHFLKREDQAAQDIMLRIQLGKKIDEELAFGFNSEFYVKSPDEMFGLFPELPDAYHNTALISDMVDLKLEFGNPLLPDFETPDNKPLPEYLSELSLRGLEKKFTDGLPKDYKDRFDYELGVIQDMGFEGYFLIVQDFIRHAKDNDIPVGPGRGSAAGSIIAYGLGITNIDPLKYDLLFERFLNPSRKEMPDIDIDFCRDRREDVINYVVDKYGADHVSQIITFGTLSAKAVIKDVARVLGFGFEDMNVITKQMPDTPGIKLADALKSAGPETQAFFNRGEKERLLLKVAETLEGMPRNAGKHAAGVVIAPEPLENIVPLAKETRTGAIISQYDKGPLEKVGLVKMDFLGLKNLTIIKMALDEIERRHNLKIDIDNIPLDDELPYKLLQEGNTKCIFQVEKEGITKLLISAKPSKFEDIVACIALYRPGPLQSGMTEEYIKRKNGEVKVVYADASLEPVLRDTFGTIVYQEQVMRISQVIGGFSMAKADILRKAMGKKKLDVMADLESEFVAGAVEQGKSKKMAIELYRQMAKFGEYGFNKSHSAAYGLITYQTAWLKSHYTLEFMKANLDADIETSESLISIIHSCRTMGIEILPPDVNQSDEYFSIIEDSEQHKKIRYGLLGLKGLGKSAVEAIFNARSSGAFSDVVDFSSRVDSHQMNRKMMEVMINSGCLDSFGHTRAGLFKALEDVLAFGNRSNQDKQAGQESLFGSFEDLNNAVHIPDIKEWDSEWKMLREKQTLGLYLTAHPLDKYLAILPYSRITNLSEIDDGSSSERKVTVMGVIEEMKTITTRKGTTFTVLSVSDLSGKSELRVYNKVFEKQKERLQKNATVIFNCSVRIFREAESVTVMTSVLDVHSAKDVKNWVKKSLHIFLPKTRQDELQRRILRLKSILRSFQGKNPVFLHYKDESEETHVVKVHSAFFVNYAEELNSRLREVLNDPKHFAWQVGNQLEMADGIRQLDSA